MKGHGLRQDMTREWMAPPEDKRQTEDHIQRITNAFFFSVTIFAVAFAFFVLSARAHVQSTVMISFGQNMRVSLIERRGARGRASSGVVCKQ
jgi:hypothetical protein